MQPSARWCDVAAKIDMKSPTHGSVLKALMDDNEHFRLSRASVTSLSRPARRLKTARRVSSTLNRFAFLPLMKTEARGVGVSSLLPCCGRASRRGARSTRVMLVSCPSASGRREICCALSQADRCSLAPVLVDRYVRRILRRMLVTEASPAHGCIVQPMATSFRPNPVEEPTTKPHGAALKSRRLGPGHGPLAIDKGQQHVWQDRVVENSPLPLVRARQDVSLVPLSVTGNFVAGCRIAA